MENFYKIDENSLPLVLSVSDVQNILHIGRVKAYQVVNTVGFPQIKVGKRILIPRKPFLQWLDTLGGVA